MGIKISKRGPSFSHLLYADDCLLCFKADLLSCQHIRHALDSFATCSGLYVNDLKSVCVFSPNTPQKFIKLMSKTLRCQHSKDIGLYLGNYVDRPNCIQRSYHNFMDSIQSRLQGWQGNLLSKSSRVTLIKPVLGSLASYYLSHIKLTQSQAYKCDSLINKFLWRHGKNQNCLHMIKWSNICQPIHMGGLGIRNCTDFNKALLTKQVWKLFSQPASLYSKTMIHKYGYGSNSDALRCPNDASPRWKGMFSSFEVIKAHFVWQVGNGEKISLSSDKWYKTIHDTHQLKNVSDLLDQHGMCKSEIVRTLYSPEDAASILTTITSTCHNPDRLIFLPSKNGLHSVKDGYIAIEHQDSHNNTTIAPPITGSTFGNLIFLQKSSAFSRTYVTMAFPLARPSSKETFVLMACALLAVKPLRMLGTLLWNVLLHGLVGLAAG